MLVANHNGEASRILVGIIYGCDEVTGTKFEILKMTNENVFEIVQGTKGTPLKITKKTATQIQFHIVPLNFNAASKLEVNLKQ